MKMLFANQDKVTFLRQADKLTFKKTYSFSPVYVRGCRFIFISFKDDFGYISHL